METNYDFSEDFKLQSIPHQTGVSEYFTWEYDGQKNIVIFLRCKKFQ